MTHLVLQVRLYVLLYAIEKSRPWGKLFLKKKFSPNPFQKDFSIGKRHSRATLFMGTKELYYKNFTGDYMFRIISLIIGYCFGCIQCAYIVGRFIGKIDIRQHGSGNAGSTNVVRVLGSKLGLLVFFLDIFKAIAAFALCTMLFDGSSMFSVGDNGFLPGLYAGFGVILGHNFPFFLKFKGGKGVAATVGIILSTHYLIALVSLAIGVLVIAISRFVSLGSLVILCLFCIMTCVLCRTMEELAITIIIALLGFIQHRGNIKRLFLGTERKFSFRRDKP